MATSLVSVSQRPSVVYSGTCAVLIHIHDAWFTQEWKRLRQLMLDAHPDRRGFTKVGFKQTGRSDRIYKVKQVHLTYKGQTTTGPFRLSQQVCEDFLRREAKWYAQYGLEVPLKSFQAVPALTKRARPERLEVSGVSIPDPGGSR